MIDKLMDLKSHGYPLEDADIMKFKIFFEQLFLWNKTHNLTRIDEHKHFMQKHLMDSLALCDHISDKHQVIDVGSGAGFPGIILATIHKNHQFFLVETSAKRCAFLRHVKSKLKLSHVTIIQDRVENIQLDVSNAYILTRAFAPLDKQVKLLSNLLNKNNTLIAMKGKTCPKETSTVQQHITKTISLPSTEFSQHRHLVYISFT